MRIALDIHGVIDTDPEFFKRLTQALRFHADKDIYTVYEVHILTGSRLGDDKIKRYLDDKNIYYTHLFSIADSLVEKDVPELSFSTENNPWFADEYWNTAKADYCRTHKIDLCLDDNDAYFEHFTTPIARYYSKDK